ncbi:MAG: tetratricopeptide repeat protein [Anaerolineae bacterium]|nr:tetratricopeptide repeat protein [Anaerolineae bacterium]
MTNEANKLKEEGLRLFEDGAYQEAIEQFELARQGFEKEGQKLAMAEMLNNIGVIHRVEGRLPEAARMLEEAMAIFVELGDRDREAQALGNLAPIYKKQGDLEKTLEAYKKSADIFGEIGDLEKQGEILMTLGIAQFDAGKRIDGVTSYEAGLRIIPKPSIRQKWLRTLLKLRMKALGM